MKHKQFALLTAFRENRESARGVLSRELVFQ